MCYLENFHVRYFYPMKVFFPILFVLQENDLVFNSYFAKKVLHKQQHKTAPFLHKHITQIKIPHNEGSISGPWGKGT